MPFLLGYILWDVWKYYIRPEWGMWSRSWCKGRHCKLLSNNTYWYITAVSFRWLSVRLLEICPPPPPKSQMEARSWCRGRHCRLATENTGNGASTLAWKPMGEFNRIPKTESTSGSPKWWHCHRKIKKQIWWFLCLSDMNDFKLAIGVTT